MEVKITERRNIKTVKSQPYQLVKVMYEGKTIWVSEADFKLDNFPEEKAGYMILKEPVSEQYNIISKKNRKTRFLTPSTGKETATNEDVKKLKVNPKALEKLKGLSKKGHLGKLLDEHKSKTPDLERSDFLKERDLKKEIKDPKLINEIIEEHKDESFDDKKRRYLREKKNSFSAPETHLAESKKGRSSAEKVAFITKLIDISTQKRTEENTRNRLIKLIGDEVGRSSISREEVEMIVEEKLKMGSDAGATDKNTRKFEIDLTRHKPINLIHFLDRFRDSEGIKFLTHSYENQGLFETKEILEMVNKEYSLFKNKLPFRLDQRFTAFAFGKGKYKGKWYFNDKQYSLNWMSNQVVDWCNNNPGMHPIERFEEEMIRPFQMSYKIENGSLELYLKEKLAKALREDFGNFEIQLIDCDKAAFKTDVDSLLAGFNGIFSSIKQRKDKSNKIKIHFSRKGRKRFLHIVHVNSFSDKSFEDEEKDILSGDLNQVKKNLFNVCDWSILSNNPSKKFNKLNVLYNISQLPSREKTEEKIEGFTHILTFYS